MAIFFSDADRLLYLRWLAAAMAVQDARLHAYVLMTNHVHLLVTAPLAASLPRIFQSLGRRYVAHVNHSYARTGTLWEGRYRSTILDSEAYLLACYRYIEANPIRAGMAACAEDYPWSSYRRNALGQADPLLDEHPVYLALGADAPARQAAYHDLFAEILDPDVVATIRDATQRSWVAGSDRFRQHVAIATGGRSVERPRRGRPPKRVSDEEPAEWSAPLLL